MLRFAPIAALCLGAALPVVGTAQSPSAQTGGAAGPAHVISLNPFLPILGYFQGEYERRVQDNLSIALAGSYVRFDDYYTNVDLKARLYPQEKGVQGVGLAAGVGYGVIRRRNDYYCDPIIACDAPRRTESAPTFAVEAHYQWLLGGHQATALAVGGGVKRYFISERDARGIERILPTLRLTIGYAFR
jgi:hypothetical protein